MVNKSGRGRPLVVPTFLWGMVTNGNDVAFQIESMYVTEGVWRVRIDEAIGYHDEQVFLVMAVKGLRNIDGTPETTIVNKHRP